MPEPPLLSVNIDHVATVREARGADYPDPVAAARLALAAGASGITAHLRSDRRHIQDRDVLALRRAIRAKLNLEMAVTEDMVERALEAAPDQATLVPERPEEVTTEGGLDVARGDRRRIAAVARRLAEAGIAVSLFVDPDPEQVAAAGELAGAGVVGFELNTDRYTRTRGEEAGAELAKLAAAAALGPRHGLAVYAGHGLTTDNVGPVAALPEVEELNIGHFLVARAVLVGLPVAVSEMLGAIAAARTRLD